jgi:transcriptional regulator with XRE-family HTH domain
LSDHTREPIPDGTLGYIRARGKRRLFTVLLEEFGKAGITKAQLARRLNMDKSLLSRYLGTPANWEFETLCDLFYAISGTILRPELAYPIETSRPSSAAAPRLIGDDEQAMETVSRAAVQRPPQTHPPKPLLGPMMETTKTFEIKEQMMKAA